MRVGNLSVHGEMVGVGDAAREDGLDRLADLALQVARDRLYKDRIGRNHVGAGADVGRPLFDRVQFPYLHRAT